MKASSGVTTFLFTDIEGSTRLWDREHDRMQVALARHDAIVRAAVEDNHGIVVKMSGDGAHGAFEDPLDALVATLQLQQGLTDPAATHGVALRVRCGLHAGVVERRDLERALAALGVEERAAVAVTLGEGLSHEEAAAVLGWPLGTLKTRVLHAKEKLRRALSEEAT